MRARNLKPSIFKNELLAVADPLYTLIFEGLWCLADREGRLEDKPAKIHLEVNPGRAYERTVQAIDWLVGNEFIQRYEANSKKYIQVVNFAKHQNPHQREAASDIPPPNGVANRYGDEPISPEQRNRILARDNHQCAWCGSADDLHVDHIQPRSRGGSSEDSNLQVLCGPCNLSKGARTSPGHAKGTAKAMPSREKAVPSPADSLFSDSGLLNPDSPSPILVTATSVADACEPEAVVTFAHVKAAYPAFTGRQDWINAEHYCNQRVERDDVTWRDLVAAADRYRTYCDSGGVSSPQYVLTPGKFFGAADQPWRQAWTPPPTKAQVKQDRSVSAAMQWLAEEEAKDAAH